MTSLASFAIDVFLYCCIDVLMYWCIDVLMCWCNDWLIVWLKKDKTWILSWISPNKCFEKERICLMFYRKKEGNLHGTATKTAVTARCATYSRFSPVMWSKIKSKHSMKKVKTLGYDRWLIYKKPRQESGLCCFSFARYLQDCVTRNL